MGRKPMRFTVVGIYTDNNQRYATDAYGFSPTEAVIDAIERCRDDNRDRSMNIDVCAVFRGNHTVRDVTVSDSRERPAQKRCRAKRCHRYTVATEYAVEHVQDLSPVEAEMPFDCRVAGVFLGHLRDYKGYVDFDAVAAATSRRKAA
jgi:hypothetical protein